ncbi:MAG: hypothetical protein V1784_08285 [bacterium]
MCRRNFFIGIAAIASTLVTLVGCEGPEGPRGPTGSSSALPVYVLGSIISPQEQDSTTDVDVEIYHSPGIPTVNINGVRIPPGNPLYRGCDPFRFCELNLPVSCGDSAELHVVYVESDGTPRIAQASIRLPGQFGITSPETSYDTLSVGDSLVVCWSPSDGVSFYWIEFYLGYDYTDPSGDWQYFHYSTDSAVIDTCFVLSQNTLFPSTEEIDSVDYGYGYLSLWAINGPAPESDQGNVTGDGIGFFYGRTWGGHISFYVSGSTFLSSRMGIPGNARQGVVEQKDKKSNLYSM